MSRSRTTSTTIGLLIAEVNIAYKGQLRLMDSPLQVTIWSKRVRAVDFTLGYEVRSVERPRDSKPAVIAETQLAAFTSRSKGCCGFRRIIGSICSADAMSSPSAACGSTTPRTAKIWPRSSNGRCGSTTRR